MTEQTGASKAERASRKYWFFAGVACGVFLLPVMFFGSWIVVAGVDGRATYRNRTTSLATLIHEASALFSTTLDDQGLPDPDPEMQLLRVVNESGQPRHPPTYLLWPPRPMIPANNDESVWLVRINDDDDLAWWEAARVRQFDFLDNVYPSPDFEAGTITAGRYDLLVDRWWNPQVRGSEGAWFIAGPDANEWPYD